MLHQWLSVMPLVLGCSAAMSQVMPPNAESEYFRTFGSGISLNSHVKPTEITYNLILEVKKPLPPNAVLTVEFENPKPGAKPVEVVLNPEPDKKRILIFSPGMPCITNGKYYQAILTMFADSSRSKILASHVQILAFFMPESMFNVLDVPVCPA